MPHPAVSELDSKEFLVKPSSLDLISREADEAMMADVAIERVAMNEVGLHSGAMVDTDDDWRAKEVRNGMHRPGFKK